MARTPAQAREVHKIYDALGPPNWRFYKVQWKGEQRPQGTQVSPFQTHRGDRYGGATLSNDDDGTEAFSWVPAWHLRGKNSDTAIQHYWSEQKLIAPSRHRSRKGELERPDTPRCRWCNSLRYSTPARLAAHHKDCKWQPSPILRTSLTHQAVVEHKLLRLQRQSETMTMGDHTVPNSLHEKQLGQ